MNMWSRNLLILGLLLGYSGISFAQSKVDATIGWTYEKADQGQGYADLNGWYGSLSYNVKPHVGLTFEHQSLWGQFQRSGVNQHAWLGGVTLKLGDTNKKVVPFIQPLAGDTRSSSSGTIQHNFTFQVAGGVDIKLGQSFAIDLIPAEYVYNRQSGSNLNSYQAGAGIQFSFGK